MPEIEMHDAVPSSADTSRWRSFAFGRDIRFDVDGGLTAVEQMFFFGAPLAHVVGWQENQVMLLRRKAGRMMFTAPQKRRGLIAFD